MNIRFFEKLFMVIQFNLRLFSRNLLRGGRRRNLFYIFYFERYVWSGIWTTVLRLLSHHTTYYTTVSLNFRNYNTLKRRYVSVLLSPSEYLIGDVVLWDSIFCFPLPKAIFIIKWIWRANRWIVNLNRHITRMLWKS